MAVTEDTIGEIEQVRRAYVRCARRNAYLLLGPAVCGVLFVATRSAAFLMAAVLLLLVCGVFFIAATARRRKVFVRAYKEKLVRMVLGRVLEDLVFEPDRGLPEEVVRATGMMRMGNVYRSDDYVSGRYKDVSVEQSDVCIEEVTSNGKTTTTVTYFRGRWMIFGFNKSFRCALQVREKSFGYAKKRGSWLRRNEPDGYMRKIEMEDEAFNERFAVYASDMQEAYYILTPAFMERIRLLADRTAGALLLCFLDQKLHVACNSGKNAFEPRMSVPVTRALLEQVYGEIGFVTQFVDELNLDRTIYKV